MYTCLPTTSLDTKTVLNHAFKLYIQEGKTASIHCVADWWLCLFQLNISPVVLPSASPTKPSIQGNLGYCGTSDGGFLWDFQRLGQLHRWSRLAHGRWGYRRPRGRRKSRAKSRRNSSAKSRRRVWCPACHGRRGWCPACCRAQHNLSAHNKLGAAKQALSSNL